jgi:HD-like signal output (HDOD) protein/signal transduction histidine kinase
MTLEELHIEKLPAVPQVLVELLRLCHRPEIEFDDFAKVVEQEPALSAKILQVANSSFYRQWSEVNHLRRLLVVLGLDTVRQIAVTSAIHQFFNSFSSKEDAFVTSIWVRSLLCAHIARDLARLTGHPSQEEAYIAGLLHRIGQLVLLQNFPEKYQDILFMDDSDTVVEQVERALFAASYCEVGALLIRSWPLHPFVADAVLYQNLPSASVADGSSLVKILNLANRLTLSVVRGSAEMNEVDDTLFGLNASLLVEVFTQARSAVIDCAEAFDIEVESHLNHVKPSRLTEDMETRRPARQQLADYVHQAALTGSAQTARPTAISQKEALGRIRRDLAIVFGLHEVGFLFVDDDDQRLTGHAEETGRPALAEISIALRDSTSLAARALREKQLHCTLDANEKVPVSIVDQQLRNLFAAEGILFLPLIAEGDLLGVVTIGLSRRFWQNLIPQRDLLELFSQQIARCFAGALQLLEAQSRQLKEQRDWQRLETRKIAHEAGNPLAIINNYLHVLSLKLGKDNPAGEEITIIKEEIVRVGDILARMRDLEPSPRSEEDGLDLNRVIRDLFKLFAGSLFQGRNLKPVLELDDDIPPLLSGAGAMKQVLMNLVKNAVEAMPDGGTLRVTTRDRVFKNGALFVELQICDDGSGLPETVLRSLFKPVVSTKKNHSGLGLTIVKNLLDQMSAEIACASTTSGTRFQILLPRTVAKNKSDG